jgi:archaellum component FlaC
MSIEDIELDVGGTKFKGIWIAVIMSFASTLGGGIWAASEFFSRLEALENTVAEAEQASTVTNQRFEDFRETWVDDKKGIVSDIKVAQTQIADAGIPELQGKLATLGTNLETILNRQQELLEIQDRIVSVEQKVTEMQVTVQKAETSSGKVDDFDKQVEKIEREIEDLWNGLDYLSNPYGGN